MHKQMLVDQWMLRETPLNWTREWAGQVSRLADGWHRDLRLPCDVHQPLIAAGIIKDPVLADYSFDSEWIEQRSWWFRRFFTPEAGWTDCDTVELLIESLDVQADLFLNGFWIGSQASAHEPYCRDVKGLLLDGENELLIRLTTGLETVNDVDLAEIDFAVSTESGNGCPERGDKRRAFIRKPTYVFGWDWCPRIATCGIVKEAWLAYRQATAFRGVRLETAALDPAVGGIRADLHLEAVIELLDLVASADADITVTLSRAGKIAATVIRPDVLLCSGLNYIDLDLSVEQADLWWPNGMGGQPLYDVYLTAVCRGAVSAWPAFRYGIRTVRLDTGRLDAERRRFELVVNGIPIFCKGGDWIPADSVYARVSDEKYRQLIGQAKAANFNMLRVWGGGLYEREAFYEACDSQGILIWQDMMFGCSTYPDHRQEFRDLVRRELDYQTARLRNHACLALFCGNNEDHWIYGRPRPDGTVRSEHEKQFGLWFSNVLMPEIMRKNCPGIPYWNSSPYGGSEPNAPQVGDVHHWQACMMNPEMAKRIDPREYDKVEARFVSEYGYPGPSPIESINRYFDGKPVDRNSRVWRLHTNTFEKLTVEAGIRRHYAAEQLDLPRYLLYAGMVQSLMLGYSLEALRFKTFCSGALFWMFNDCWGEVGWTIVDYDLRRKISFYGVRRAFSPRRLIMREQDGVLVVVGCNDTPNAIDCKLLTGWIRFDGTREQVREHALTLPAFSRQEVARQVICGDLRTGIHFAWPILPDEAADGADRGSAPAAADDDFGQMVPALYSWGEYSRLDLCPPSVAITAERDEQDDRLATVLARTYCHGVYLDTGPEYELSDNYFDLLPGESRTVRIYGAAGKHFDLRTAPVDRREG